MDFSPSTNYSRPDDVRAQSRLLKQRALELASLCHDIVAQLDSAILDLSEHINSGDEELSDVSQKLVAEHDSSPSVAPELSYDSGSGSKNKLADDAQNLSRD